MPRLPIAGAPSSYQDLARPVPPGVPLREGPAGSPETRQPAPVRRKRCDRAGQRVGVAGRDEHGGPLVDQLGHARDLGGHDRQARGQILEQLERGEVGRSVGGVWRDSDVRARERGGHLGVRERAGDASAHSLEERPAGPVPHDRQGRRGRPEQAPCGRQRLDAVPRTQRAREHRRGWADRTGGRRREQDGVHPVRADRDAARAPRPRVARERPAHGEHQVGAAQHGPLEQVGHLRAPRACGSGSASCSSGAFSSTRCGIASRRGRRRAGGRVEGDPLVERGGAEAAQALLEPRLPVGLRRHALGRARPFSGTGQTTPRSRPAGGSGAPGLDSRDEQQHLGPLAGHGRGQLAEVHGGALGPPIGDPGVGREVGDSHQAASGNIERSSAALRSSEKLRSTCLRPSAARRARELGIRPQPLDRVGQRGRVALRNDQAGALVQHRLGQAADRRGHDRHAQRHRLEHRGRAGRRGRRRRRPRTAGRRRPRAPSARAPAPGAALRGTGRRPLGEPRRLRAGRAAGRRPRSRAGGSLRGAAAGRRPRSGPRGPSSRPTGPRSTPGPSSVAPRPRGPEPPQVDAVRAPPGAGRSAPAPSAGARGLPPRRWPRSAPGRACRAGGRAGPRGGRCPSRARSRCTSARPCARPGSRGGQPPSRSERGRGRSPPGPSPRAGPWPAAACAAPLRRGGQRLYLAAPSQPRASAGITRRSARATLSGSRHGLCGRYTTSATQLPHELVREGLVRPADSEHRQPLAEALQLDQLARHERLGDPRIALQDVAHPAAPLDCRPRAHSAWRAGVLAETELVASSSSACAAVLAPSNPNSACARPAISRRSCAKQARDFGAHELRAQPVGLDQPQQAEAREGARADQLLPARTGAGDAEGRRAERQRLAERVVAAHRDQGVHVCKPVREIADGRVELDAGVSCQVLERSLVGRARLRAGHHHPVPPRRPGGLGEGLEQPSSVFPSTRRRQDPRAAPGSRGEPESRGGIRVHDVPAVARAPRERGRQPVLAAKSKTLALP